MACLAGGALGAPEVRARADSAGDVAIQELRGARGAIEAVVCTPAHLAAGERAPLLVLLHGLAETADARVGAYAWVERYGLVGAYERLRRPPLRNVGRRVDWSDTALAAANRALAARPFRGLVIACPFVPRDAGGPSLAAFARWVARDLVPRVRSLAMVDAGATSIDGCSFGGYIALETFLRYPDVFAAWGGVQSAIGRDRAAGYAARLEAVVKSAGAPRPLHVETSTADAFREGNEALAAELARRGVPHDLTLLPGPHDQPWLRESGTAAMLLWHDALTRSAAPRTP